MPLKIEDVTLYSSPEASQILNITTGTIRSYNIQEKISGQKVCNIASIEIRDAYKRNGQVVKELDKETLTRLYLKEKRSTDDIAQMTGCSSTKVRYRCIKCGIKLRPNTWKRKTNIEKSVLVRLYVKENKSLKEVAEILSCSHATVVKRCKEHDILLRSQRVEGLTKQLLQNLYVQEGKTTREIADIVGCSGNLIRLKCKAFGITLRNPGTKKVKIDEATLRRLYLAEEKCMYEIAKILNCSPSVITKRIRRLGLKKRRAITKKEEAFLSWVTANTYNTFETVEQA